MKMKHGKLHRSGNSMACISKQVVKAQMIVNRSLHLLLFVCTGFILRVRDVLLQYIPQTCHQPFLVLLHFLDFSLSVLQYTVEYTHRCKWFKDIKIRNKNHCFPLPSNSPEIWYFLIFCIQSLNMLSGSHQGLCLLLQPLLFAKTTHKLSDQCTEQTQWNCSLFPSVLRKHLHVWGRTVSVYVKGYIQFLSFSQILSLCFVARNNHLKFRAELHHLWKTELENGVHNCNNTVIWRISIRGILLLLFKMLHFKHWHTSSFPAWSKISEFSASTGWSNINKQINAYSS